MLGRGSCLGLSVAALFMVCGQGLSPAPAAGLEATQPSAQTSSTAVSPAAEGPERLKRQARITVETNAPSGVATNGIPPKEKSSQWKARWEGWDGLHLDLSRKTMINDPLLDLREETEWTNAPRVFHLEELKMSGKIGGKVAVDGAAYVADKDLQGFEAGAELRRARLYAKGDCLLVLPVSYQLEIGYIPDQFYIEESYLAFKNRPYIGELRLGQYQAPMSLDIVTSSRDLTFMEPAAPLQALAPGVNAGVQMGRPVFHQRATWALGIFTDGLGSDYGDASKNFGRAITRLTALPIYHPNPDQPGSAQLLHLGLSANILYSGNSTVRYQARPESHLAPHVVDTGDIFARGALVLGSEVAWVSGPFSIQGEYLRSFVEHEGGSALNFDGFYASASWFLTGESRPYSPSDGVFGRVIPKHNFNWGKGGWGAWEVAGRYSFVNLDNRDIHGGRMGMFMAGLNWHLHSHVKCRFDYGFGHVGGRTPEGNINVFQTRVEVDF